MGDRRRRLVADRPAGDPEAPDEVDVLADDEVLVEPAHLLEGGASDQQGRRGNERDPAAWAERPLERPPIERRAGPFVVVQPARRAEWRGGDDAGCDGADGWIDELGEERVEPSVGRDAVGVDER